MIWIRSLLLLASVDAAADHSGRDLADKVTRVFRDSAKLNLDDANGQPDFVEGGNSQRVIDKLLSDKINESYDKLSRPIPDCSVYDCSHRIRIFMGLQFQKLVALNQRTQTLTMVVQKRVTWPDYRLAYNATEYFAHVPVFGQGDAFAWNSSHDFVPIEQHLVWSPDIQLLDATVAPRQITKDPRLFWYDSTKLSNEGYNLAMVFQQEVTVNCPMDLSRFPFDDQTCQFRFGDWSASDRYFEFGTLDIGKIWSVPDVNNKFRIGFVNVSYSAEKYDLQDVAEFPEIVYSIKFHRFPDYYVLHYVLPLLILLLVAQSVFWMDLHGERHSLGSALVLTLMMVSFLIAPLLPATNHTMWLEDFQVVCYVLITFPVFCSILSEHYGWRSPEGAEWAATADMCLRVLFPLTTIVALVCLFYDVYPLLQGDIFWLMFFNCIVYVAFLASGIRELTRYRSNLKAEIQFHQHEGP